MALAAALVTCLALLPLVGSARDLDQRVPARAGGLLQIDLDMGEDFLAERLSLDIRSHDADEVWAVADLSGPGGSTVSFRLDHDERGVRLYGRSGGLLAWLLGGPGVSVRVWVPREFSVDARCSSGPIRIEEVHGEIRARTSDADIELVSGEGSARLRTSDGGVQVTELLGDVEIRTSEGPVEVSWVSGDVDVRTGGGGIELTHIDGRISATTDEGPITLEDVSGPVEARTERGPIYASFRGAAAGFLETRRGSVEVFLPGETGAELEARSLRGGVDIAPGLAWEGERGENHVLGRVNGGGAALRLYTGRGLVRVGER